MPSATFLKVGQATSNIPHLHWVIGKIQTDSTTPTRLKGTGYTVSKPGTGRYLITLNQKCPFIVSAVGTLRKAAGSATFLTGPVTSDAAGATTVEFRVENASGTATDAGNTDTIDFIIAVTKTRLKVT